MTHELIKKQCNVFCISRTDIARIQGIHLIKGDICDLNFWIEFLGQVDLIYHLAGNTSIQKAEISPIESLTSTILPINHIINASKILRKIPKVVFTSTATVYGVVEKYPVLESFETKPLTMYDLHKTFAEKYLEMASKLGFIDATTLRLTNVYGPSIAQSSSRDRGVINNCVEKALKSENLVIYGDGNYLRDYIYISDVINALLFAGYSEGLNGQIFNIGSGVGVTLADMFQLIVSRVTSISKKNIRIDQLPWPENTTLIQKRNFVANIEKFKRYTKWKPLVNIEKGVDSLVSKLINDKYYETY